MIMKHKIPLPNKETWEKVKHNKVTSVLKKETWKTSISAKKKLKKYQNDPEKILERFKKIHRKTYDYSKVNYESLNKPIIIICKKHGEFKTTPKLHLGRDSKNIDKRRPPIGCNKCIVENVIIDLQKIHGEKYNYSKLEFKYKSFPIIIICPEHGEFKQTLTKHMNGSNCPICKITEKKISLNPLNPK